MLELTAPAALRPDVFPVHPLGSQARVLLTSVFGPYARDDEYGSRAINPMELYHNQVTRLQGIFSLRMFHRSWGIMLIQANIQASCNLLDFPTLERFVEEIRSHPYDVVGISSIIPNVGKVARMCELVREHLPRASLVVGGHVANLPGLGHRVGADHVVRGDGVRWFRRYLGEDEARPIRHPVVASSVGAWTMGVRLADRCRSTAAALIPSVGCPLGCDFCSTSAMFGGKGRSVAFYDRADDLFSVMCGIERTLGVRSFFVMDENFLLYRARALRLLELMRAHAKAWALYVFSSANALRLYRAEELVALGVSWVWLGLEGRDAAYAKLRRVHTRSLVRGLQAHGIRVLGSSIIGLPEHTPESIDGTIEDAVVHATEFHQFMLCTPIPGTPLHAEHLEKGTLLDERDCPLADAHGQLRFNYRHPHIHGGRETEYLLEAFRRDFARNGPSVVRIARTLLRGWRRHKDHRDPRVRERYRRECRDLPTLYAGALWAAQRWLAPDASLAARVGAVRRAIDREFGLKARLAGPLVGRFLLSAMRREARRLGRGRTYEPPTFYETNRPGAGRRHRKDPRLGRWVEPSPRAAEGSRLPARA